MHVDAEYLNLLHFILEHGEHRPDRTGIGTRSVFGERMVFDLQAGFPILTTKKVHFKSVVHELLWMLSGSTNVRDLQKHGVTIWDEWADKNGNLGPTYGRQWRSWPDWTGDREIDQIAQLIDGIKRDPYSRRHVVSAWNVEAIPEMALAPCHTLFQMYVSTGGKLSCQLYQRSADVFLGLPFNIASYALLTHMVAHVTGLQASEFVHVIGDAHLYQNHIEAAREQATREPRELPILQLNPDVRDIFAFTAEDIRLIGYDPHPAIPAPVAI